MTPRQDDPWADAQEPEAPIVPWTAEQVQALVQQEPPLSLAKVALAQGVVGGLLALAWGLWGSDPASQARSTLWGAAAVVLPQALMAWGLRHRPALAAQALAQFLVWELLKVGLAVVILVIAAWQVKDLSWPAFLLAFVVGLKLPIGLHMGSLRRAARAGQKTN